LASSTQYIKFSVASLLLYSKVLQATSVLSILTWHMCMHTCWLWNKKQHCNWGEDLIVCESVTWEVWCCDLPSLTCSSVKGMSVCLCTRFIPEMMILSIRLQMCNKHPPTLGTRNRWKNK
jgi:hypothetical protein